jgi:hypothetical protein
MTNSIITLILLAPLMLGASATTTSSPPILDHSSPKALLRSFYTTNGDVDEATMRALFHVTNPVEQKLVDATIQIALAQSRLRAAQAARFGKSPTTARSGSAAIPQPTDLAEIDALQEKIEGDHATVTVPNSPGFSMEFVRIGGNWKLPISPLAARLDQPNAQLLDKGIAAQVEVIDGLTKEVKAGQFASEQAVQDELKKRLAARMQEMIKQATPASTRAASAPAP